MGQLIEIAEVTYIYNGKRIVINAKNLAKVKVQLATKRSAP